MYLLSSATCVRLVTGKNQRNLCRVLEWLERRDCDRNGLGSKPTRAIPLCA